MMAMFKASLEEKLDILIRTSEVNWHRNEQAMYQLAMNFENCRKKWKNAEEELVESRSRLAKVEIERNALEVRFKHARNQVDVELKRRHKAEMACEQLERRLQLLQDMLRTEAPTMALQNEDQKYLHTALSSRTGPAGQPCARLPVVDGTLTSNTSHSGISYDRTSMETLDMNVSAVKPMKQKNRDKRCSSRILVDGPPVAARRSRSLSSDQTLDHVGATPESASDRTASKTGNEWGVRTRSPSEVAPRRRSDWNRRLGLLAEQITVQYGSVGNQQTLLTAPAPPATPAPQPASPDPFTTPRNLGPTRPHIFVSKTIIRPESCVPCGKRIRFGKMAFKCRSCSVVCHPDCRERCPALCAPNFTAACVKNGEGMLADFAPRTAPMIPSLVVHCINEIEQRGLQEPGIYRVPGCERAVRELKEQYVRGKGIPLLSRVSNIHVVCGLLKDFLRKLREPVVTFRLHPTFMAVADLPDDKSTGDLCRAVCDLPQANRETLAFLIIHLQRVMGSPECKMDKRNLTRVFGPTIVGHSNPNPHPLEVFEDTKRQPQVVEQLLSLPSDYWMQIVPVGQESAQTGTSTSSPGLFTSGRLFKPLTSPEVAEMSRLPTCCLPPGILSPSGNVHPGKIFPLPTPN